MTRFFVQEGLNKWLVMDRETGLTVESRATKRAANELSDEMNQKLVLTYAVNSIYSKQHEARH